jgi:hypothetical protein
MDVRRQLKPGCAAFLKSRTAGCIDLAEADCTENSKLTRPVYLNQLFKSDNREAK